MSATVMQVSDNRDPEEERAQSDAEQDRPNHEQVAVLAFKLWHDRGCPDGSPELDWFQAEELLQAKE